MRRKVVDASRSEDHVQREHISTNDTIFVFASENEAGRV